MTIRRAPSRSPSATLRSGAKLGGYFAVSVGASVLGTAESEAAVVSINLGGFGILGPNGQAPDGGYLYVSNFPIPGPSTTLFNYGATSNMGLSPFYGGPTNALAIAIGNGSGARPRNFYFGSVVGSSATFSVNRQESIFRVSGSDFSPDFGPGSYLGFRVTSGTDVYYGYLEATWSASSNQFQLLSGAYQSTPNAPITIGVVPEPSAIALTGIGALALGGGAIRRSRKARKESLANAV